MSSGNNSNSPTVTTVRTESTKIIIDKIKSETFNKDVGCANSFVPATFNNPTLSNSTHVYTSPSVNIKSTVRSNASPIIDKLRISMLDHSATKVIITKSTFKYGLIILVSLLLMAFLIFIFVVGALNVHNCQLNPQIPIYLLVMGLMGAIRVLLFFSCPFSYSKSVAAKIYENVIENLIIDRFKVSNKASKAYTNAKLDGSSLSDTSFISRLCTKSSRLFSFIFNFCCCCCCLSCFYSEKNICCKKKANDEALPEDTFIASSQPTNQQVLFQLNQSQSATSLSNTVYLSTCESQDFNTTDGISKSKSFSSMSTKTTSSNLSNLFSDVLFFNVKCLRGGSSRSRKRSISSYTTNSKVSISSFKAKDNYPRKICKRGKSPKNINKRGLPKATYIYAKRTPASQKSSRRHASYHYTSHKHIERHYKQQRPYRLIDVRSVRYGAAHILQKCIDLFIIIWFVFGNYWVLVIFDQNSDKLLPMKLNVSYSSFFGRKRSSVMVVGGGNSSMNASQTTPMPGPGQTLNCDIFCYRTAFLQIIGSYSLIFLFVVSVITYRIYLITCQQRKTHHAKKKGKKNTKTAEVKEHAVRIRNQ